jgi:HrpA-like RNA helicase
MDFRLDFFYLFFQESTVGYKIRFESERPRNVGSITFCTTGIVLQKLRNNPELSDISHIILDEVHERDLFTDILIGVLKYLVEDHNKIKVIVMSASLDVDKFSSYLNYCPVVNVQGRTFPVEHIYLEDFYVNRGPYGLNHRSLSVDDIDHLLSDSDKRKLSMEKVYYKAAYGDYAEDILAFENSDELDLNMIAKHVLSIHNDYDVNSGAILIFLPGWDEICNLGFILGEEYLSIDLERDNPSWLGDNVDIHYLHSQVLYTFSYL